MDCRLFVEPALTYCEFDSKQQTSMSGIITISLKKMHLKIWWRHQMATSSALLAIPAGNSPVVGEFPAQRPVTLSFNVFFDLRLNKRLNKHWWGWGFETPSCPLWRNCNMSTKRRTFWSDLNVSTVYSCSVTWHVCYAVVWALLCHVCQWPAGFRHRSLRREFS